jgi:hypothetical protein
MVTHLKTRQPTRAEAIVYLLVAALLWSSSGVLINGQGLVRVGDQIPSGPGILAILGPPAAPFVNDTGAP